jgi:hypothetical protein
MAGAMDCLTAELRGKAARTLVPRLNNPEKSIAPEAPERLEKLKEN